MSSKEMKSPQIHHLISQRRWRVIKSTILISPRNGRALKSTTIHLKLFKVLGSMYLYTHHMSIYLGSSNPPSLLFDLSKEMKSPQIHHFDTLSRSCRALKSTTCPFKTIQSAWVYVPSNPPHVHLSWVFKPTISLIFDLSKEIKSPKIHHLISQRRWRALKSTILIPPRSCKALKSTSCPFKTIQSTWVYVPSNPWSVHFDLSKEMKSPQIHHCDTSKEP